MPRLYLALSGHGLGHLGQIAPLIRALAARVSGLELTVEAAIAEPLLRMRLARPFTLIEEAPDPVPVMHNALDVDRAATVAAYASFHADYDARLARACRRLGQMRPDLLLADIPYLPLAAAARLGIPRVAVCSLNWADILDHYGAGDRRVPGWSAAIRAAYAGADRFIQPQPHMPMAGLPNRVAVGPIADVGRDRRDALRARLGIARGRRLVLVSLGGIGGGIDVARLPVIDGYDWLVERVEGGGRRDLHPVDALGWPFVDLLRAADLLLTKPGYGLFTEAACNGVPVLYVRRGDWPEEPYLCAWLERVGRACAIGRDRLETPELARRVVELNAAPRPAPVVPSGIDGAVALLLPLLGVNPLR